MNTKKTRIKQLLALCFLFAGITAFAQFKVVGYLPTWSGLYPGNVATIDLDKLTHLNIAFANPNTAGTLIPSSGTNANVSTVVQTGHAHNLKVLMSIGGGGASGTNYHNLISSNIPAFVNSIVNYVQTYNLDGIDVDIEGNILDGSTLTASQYQNFVSQLGTALHANGKLMTSALASWFGNYVTNTAAAQFDFINAMSYDATGPWAPQNPGQHSPYSMAVNDFQYWNGTKGVAADKLTVGVPFYGYGFGTYANQGISFCNIVNTYPGSQNNDQVGSGGNAIYYNGIPTIQQKTTYALQNAGGIMIWELTQDCFTTNSLLTAIDDVITSFTTGVAEQATVMPTVEVWPNPSAGKLSVKITGSYDSDVVFSFYNLLGEHITQQTMHKTNDKVYSPDISSLHDGFYLLEILTAENKSITRIVLNR